jgi:hypothetical protein
MLLHAATSGVCSLSFTFGLTESAWLCKNWEPKFDLPTAIPLPTALFSPDSISISLYYSAYNPLGLISTISLANSSSSSKKRSTAPKPPPALQQAIRLPTRNQQSHTQPRSTSITMLAQQKLSCSSSMRLPSHRLQQLACSQAAALQRPALRRMDRHRSRVSIHADASQAPACTQHA